ncbi:MAG TPA: aminomethyl transferase family protein [Desulfobacteraceae bacterium]|nr:aminomethyltransferase family protein [Deltaproteobacteria bacterium]HDI60181.1 aminomethyl transferase family protein [Desulfobacteraceae bacterium]
MNPEPRTTPLYPRHRDAGANMGDFGGYRMPLWYPAGMRREHRAVILGAGLFDTSHMALLTVAGAGAHRLLQRTFTKDMDRVGPADRPLADGRCAYGAFLDSRGHVIDDAIVCRRGPEDYFVVVNAGMGPAVAGHLAAEAGASGLVVTDLTDRVAKLDLQGPASAWILGRVLEAPERAFQGLGYFGFKGHFDRRHPGAAAVHLDDGTPLLLSRTGYTGEFGFELFVEPEQAAALWDRLLAAGADFGLIPCGLAARDSLRAGAVLPLSHQDIGDWPFVHHPWPFALPYAPDGRTFTKDFIGAAALIQAAASAPHTLAFVGRDPRKVAAGPDTRVLDEVGRAIGTVLTCATDTAIGWVDGLVVSLASPGRPEGFDPKGLSCGFVRVERPLPAGSLLVLDDGRRRIEVAVAADIRPDRTARRSMAQMWG